jgi:hypothetical protein
MIEQEKLLESLLLEASACAKVQQRLLTEPISSQQSEYVATS